MTSLAHLQLAPEQDKILLHLGCGTNLLEGWCNTDIAPYPGTMRLDFSQPFPFANETVDAAFCEHTIEHIDKKLAVAMCREVYRVLKKGSAYRIVTPSLENMMGLVKSPESPTARHYLQWWRNRNDTPSASMADALNSMFYDHGHKHIYSATEMVDLLIDIGFVNVTLFNTGEYGHAVFDRVDSHGKVIGEDINNIEAFAVEAEKP